MAVLRQEGVKWLAVAIVLSVASASPVYVMNQEVLRFEDEAPTTSAPLPTCGYDACNLGKEGMLNVHLVPHTHDDVGWLKTVDQYYYGSKQNIQKAAVKYTLDTVVQELLADPAKRFIYVEIAFFSRWWNQQSDSMRHQVKGLVNNGQLEFILGGWCMNDEASTHYNAIIDQHTLGFRFLMDNFGECGRPHVGWQIDPFGHSREQASLFAQFGFDGLFFGRLDYQDKEKRLKDKTMEMMWFGSENLGDQSTLFTGVNYNGYGPPPGFCFDVLCDDEPIMDDKNLNDYNKDERVKTFIDYVKQQASNYTTNHIMLTMGSDFQFIDAHVNYDNMDRLIKYVNELQNNGSKVNTFYSTPNCYLKALNDAKQTYTSKSDDFFPYAHRAHSFWTGYFTSRAALKDYVRKTNNFLQVCKQLEVLAGLEQDTGSYLKIRQLSEAMGVAQHHDAVSGTEKQAVAYDYAQRLAKGIAGGEDVINSAYSKLIPKSSAKYPTQHLCTLTNITMCPFTEGQDNFVVTVYNPIGRTRSAWVQVPVAKSSYSVKAANNTSVPSQFVALTNATKSIPERNGSKAVGHLLFQVVVPALGFNTFFIQKSQADIPVEPVKQGAPAVMQNAFIKVDFNASSGRLAGITNKKSGVSAPITQDFLMYLSMPGNNSEPKFQASGAYIFRPQEQTPSSVSDVVKTVSVSGSLVQEVHQTYGDWASQVIRLYDDAVYVEVEWTVGPIPIDDKVGKEIVSRYTSTDVDNKAVFLTDANGRELLKRVLNYRPTWVLNQTEPVAGNYYPVNSRIAIQDENQNVQLTILTDRSQGGSSLKDGEVELMLHRRTLYDDSLGVGEPLNETGSDSQGLIVRGRHYLILGSIEESGQLHRDLAESLFMAPVVSYGELTGTVTEYTTNFTAQWSGLYNQELPANVHLLTLEGWEAGTVLLRLEHFYEKDENVNLSKPVEVNIKGLFGTFDISGVDELTLGGDQKLEDAKRLVWNVKNYGPTKSDMSSYVTPVDPKNWTVTLQPMQIRTFQLTLKD